MSTWLYQFWLFSFQTAKNWGRGPRNWTAELLRFDDFHDPISIASPNTLLLKNTLWATVGSPRNVSANTRVSPSPSPLCRWAIHVRLVLYQPLPGPPAEIFDNPYGEGSWRAWGNSKPSPSFEETLTNGLESNDFSTFRVSDLPVAVPQIAEAARRSPSELLVEALGFSIMGRNVDLTVQLAEKLFDLTEKDHGDFYPFHLATSYLDGSQTCCSLLDLLVSAMPPKLSIRQTYTNNLGHTILDNLMICILKSHSSCVPGDVDDVWQKEKRFAGEEVDICGRWDADSDCVRSLLANGEVTIPFEWKHKFCHTSAQAICHCINTMFFPSYAGDIDTASGLFVKRCLNCGFKLQLKPLHTLVLTALALAQQGAAGEDLFGILACALSILWNGADASLTAEISLDLLLRGEQTDHCSHKELSPADLAELLASQYQIAWTKDVRIGWQIFCYLLRSSSEEWISDKSRANKGSNYSSFGDDEMEIDRDSESDDGSFGMEHECCDGGKGCCYFGRNEDLGRIYAAVQTELVTYRRIAENDPWTSTNFNMEELLQSLLREYKPRIGLLEKGLLKSFCRCGLFYHDFGRCLTAEDACVSYFMNMDVWSRASFIGMPERGYE